jgi:hypothetical protein
VNIKDYVKNSTVKFKYFRDSALWYETSNSFLFPVPLEDIGTTTFEAEYKAIKLMRWIRKAIEDQKEAKEIG